MGFVPQPNLLAVEGQVTIFREEGAAAIGKLQDLSATGFGGIITNEIPLETNRSYPCYLEIGFMAPISATIEIRFMGHEGHQKQKRFGANFISINIEERQIIERTVIDIQRQLIRKGLKPNT